MDEFVALLRQEQNAGAGSADALLKEGELWAEQWLTDEKATLQLRAFSVAPYSKPGGEAAEQRDEGTLGAFETLHRRLEWLMRFYIDGFIPVKK